MLPPRPHLFGFLLLLAPTLTLAAGPAGDIKPCGGESDLKGTAVKGLVELARLVALKV